MNVFVNRITSYNREFIVLPSCAPRVLNCLQPTAGHWANGHERNDLRTPWYRTQTPLHLWPPPMNHRCHGRLELPERILRELGPSFFRNRFTNASLLSLSSVRTLLPQYSVVDTSGEPPASTLLNETTEILEPLSCASSSWDSPPAMEPPLYSLTQHRQSFMLTRRPVMSLSSRLSVDHKPTSSDIRIQSDSKAHGQHCICVRALQYLGLSRILCKISQVLELRPYYGHSAARFG
jgi:hypothetical protein